MKIKSIEVLGQGDVTISFPDSMSLDYAIAYLCIFFNKEIEIANPEYKDTTEIYEEGEYFEEDDKESDS